jgi:hypothetical protein
MMSSRTANRQTRIRRASRIERSATVMVAPLSGRHYARTTCPVDAAPFKRDGRAARVLRRMVSSLGIQQQGPRASTDRGSSASARSAVGDGRVQAQPVSFATALALSKCRSATERHRLPRRLSRKMCALYAFRQLNGAVR